MDLIWNGNRLLTPGGNLHIIYNQPPIQSEGVLNFNNAAYVELDTNPDLSGTKILRWKMWIDSVESPTGWLFSLGSDGDSFQLYENSISGIRLGNRNRIMSTQGDKVIPITTGITGYVLDCMAVKTINQFLWFQIGGYASGDQNLSSTGSPPSTVSRFGADGAATSPNNSCAGMYIWDIQAEDSDGTTIGAWSGYGTAPTTSTEWVDTINSNNGTVIGTGTLKTFTNPSLYTDWFLPSKDELTAMYDNLKVAGYGNFNTTQAYWTSSEFSTTDVWAILFSNRMIVNVAKSGTYYARAARTFTASAGAYSLTDLGPAGGRIFYIDGGTTYYEAAPTDSVFGASGGSYNGCAWSNITTMGIGPVTGTAIGTGASNTSSIINSTGFKYGAPKACNDLSVKI